LAAIATITINDGAGSPVSHDFDPAGLPSGVARWEDRVGGIAVGYPVITMSVRSPTKNSKASKVVVKIAVPTLEEASSGGSFVPPPTKAFDCLFVGEFILPQRSSLLEREHLMAYCQNLFAHATLVSAIEDTENVW
jgi:hypothetical protein